MNILKKQHCFDNRVIDWIADTFKKEEGIDLRNDKSALQRLKEAAEKAKIELSGMTSANINLPFITADATGPKHFDATLTRAEFDRITADLVASIIAAVTFVICMAGLIIGKKFGTKLAGKASVFGGVILIVIGIEIWLTGIL